MGPLPSPLRGSPGMTRGREEHEGVGRDCLKSATFGSDQVQRRRITVISTARIPAPDGNGVLMRYGWKAAMAAIALAGGAALATPASAQSFGLGIGPNGGVTFSYDSGGYCDDWGCPGDFWNLPVYYGPVFWNGYWYDGPLYYRDWFGRRQFWIHGGWRYDEWRGPGPDRWRAGRLGPA